jgi:hypothetical protein
VGDGVEVAFEVCINHPYASSIQLMLNFAQGVFTAASRSEAVAALAKFALEDRFEYTFQRRLHYAVFDRGDAQWSLASA